MDWSVFFVFDVFYARFHEGAYLLRFKPAINKGSESITKEIHSSFVRMELIIFLEK